MFLPLLIATALHAATPHATPTAADSLTGAWRISGDVMGTPVNELCTLAHAGAALTGSCKNTDNADAKAYDVTGSVKDGKVTFTHGADYQGSALTITFTSAASTAKQLSGTIDVQPFGVSGTFTAAPATAAVPTPPKP